VEKVSIQRLIEQVKKLDLYEIMLLNIRDHADWVITEFTRICREEAEEKSRGNIDDYVTLFNQCLYESRDEVKKMLYSFVHNLIEATNMLFGIFYNYDLPPATEREKEEFYRKIDEIIQDALRRYYPYETTPIP
jgi:dihydroxyacetone kinase-like predicted kinase